jgi:hypothetical protein
VTIFALCVFGREKKGKKIHKNAIGPVFPTKPTNTNILPWN